MRALKHIKFGTADIIAEVMNFCHCLKSSLRDPVPWYSNVSTLLPIQVLVAATRKANILAHITDKSPTK